MGQFLLYDLLQNSKPLLLPREWDMNLNVESSSPESGIINKIDSVCCRHYYDPIILRKPVHFSQKLSNRVSCLRTIKQMAFSTTKCVNLVYEDDTAIIACSCFNE